jgi:hypothetical protein
VQLAWILTTGNRMGLTGTFCLHFCHAPQTSALTNGVEALRIASGASTGVCMQSGNAGPVLSAAAPSDFAAALDGSSRGYQRRTHLRFLTHNSESLYGLLNERLRLV